MKNQNIPYNERNLTRIFIVFRSLSQNVGALPFQPHVNHMPSINYSCPTEDNIKVNHTGRPIGTLIWCIWSGHEQVKGSCEQVKGSCEQVKGSC
jgi:hypothetical protein